MEGFYNTINAKGEDLVRLVLKGLKQSDAILEFFKANPGIGFTPSEVHQAILPNCPLTSARRAITSLANAGKLVKTSQQRIGAYNVLNYVWKLAEDEAENEMD